jgi:hypothetical protein
MTYDTDDIAAFIVDLTERTPAKDRTVQIFDVAVERKFPGIDIDQLYAAHDIAAAILKARTRRYARRRAQKAPA